MQFTNLIQTERGPFPLYDEPAQSSYRLVKLIEEIYSGERLYGAACRTHLMRGGSHLIFEINCSDI